MKGRPTVGAENKQTKSWSSNNRTGSVTCLEQSRRKPFFLVGLRMPEMAQQSVTGGRPGSLVTSRSEGQGCCGAVDGALFWIHLSDATLLLCLTHTGGNVNSLHSVCILVYLLTDEAWPYLNLFISQEGYCTVPSTVSEVIRKESAKISFP